MGSPGQSGVCSIRARLPNASTWTFSGEGGVRAEHLSVACSSDRGQVSAINTIAVSLSPSSCSSVSSRGSPVSQRPISRDDTDAQSQVERRAPRGSIAIRAGRIDRSRADASWPSIKKVAIAPRRNSDRASKGCRHHQRRSRGVHRSSSRRKRRAPGSLIERCLLRSWSPRQLSPRSLSPTVMPRSMSPGLFDRDNSSLSSVMGD